MKTPMQRLLSMVEQIYNKAESPHEESAINDVINLICQQGIPEEREEIKRAHCHNRCLNDQTYECSINAFDAAEKYYNERYEHSS